jgi:GNAT superfamily N-acetyltransferase
MNASKKHLLSQAHTPTCAYVWWNGQNIYREKGVAEADHIEDGRWWIARVLVQPKEMRGQGVGTAMLKRLIELVKANGCKCLQVCPGGYDDDPRAIKFYKKNGFVPADDKGLLEIRFP